MVHFLFCCVFFSMTQIIRDRPAEKKGFLRHVTDFVTQPLLRIFTHIFSVDQNIPVLNIIKPHQKAGDRRFSRTGTAYNCCCLSFFYSEVYILQYHFLCSRVTECHISEFHSRVCFSLANLHNTCCRLRSVFQYLSDTVRTDLGAGNEDKYGNSHQQIHKCQHSIFNDRHNISDLHTASRHLTAADPDDHQCTDIHKHHDEWYHDCKYLICFNSCCGILLESFIRAHFFISGAVKSTNHPDPDNTFSDSPVDLIQQDLQTVKYRDDFFTHHDNKNNDRYHKAKNRECQQPVF